jgi:hypothetical protein
MQVCSGRGLVNVVKVRGCQIPPAGFLGGGFVRVPVGFEFGCDVFVVLGLTSGLAPGGAGDWFGSWLD